RYLLQLVIFGAESQPLSIRRKERLHSSLGPSNGRALETIQLTHIKLRFVLLVQSGIRDGYAVGRNGNRLGGVIEQSLTRWKGDGYVKASWAPAGQSLPPEISNQSSKHCHRKDPDTLTFSLRPKSRLLQTRLRPTLRDPTEFASYVGRALPSLFRILCQTRLDHVLKSWRRHRLKF